MQFKQREVLLSMQTTKEQITSIEEQIRKLKEKQRRILANSQKEIGKYMMDTWGVEDVNEAKKLIDEFSSQVKSQAEFSSQDEGKREGDLRADEDRGV
jgi:hypothetical protein